MALMLPTGTVAEVMTSGILTCLPETPLVDVARTMAAQRVHAIVVFDLGDGLRPWGVVSDLDLMGAIETGARAGSVAASPAVTVRVDDTLAHAAQLMREYGTAHLIVVTDESAPLPVGIISTLDVARAVASAA